LSIIGELYTWSNVTADLRTQNKVLNSSEEYREER